jgi:hypothetical protein
MYQIVPLSPLPNQTLTAQLQVDGNAISLNLSIRWSTMAGYWVMSVSSSQNNLLLDSVPMVTGWYPAANILAQYGYLAIGSAYLLNLGNDDSDYPGLTDLGSAFVLLWGDTAS